MANRILGWLAAAVLAAVPVAASAQTATNGELQPVPEGNGGTYAPPAEGNGSRQMTQQKAQKQAQAIQQLGTGEPTKEQLQAIQPGDVFSQLHQINRSEIASAQLALDKAQSQQVKSMARKILADHQELDRQLMETAQKQGIQLSESFSLPGAAMQLAMKESQEQLGKLSGEAFDKAWLAAQPMQHQYAIAVIDLAQQAGLKQQGVSQLLDQAKQKVEQHHQTASRTLEQNVRVAATPQQSPQG